jgi:hypothetical protein
MQRFLSFGCFVYLVFFLYSLFSFRCRVTNSFFLVLLMIVAIALLHREGMSSMLKGSVSCRILEAIGMAVVFSGGGGRSLCCWGFSCCSRWADFRSLVRRLIFLVSDFFIYCRSFWVSMGGVCLVIGHIACACFWYVFIMVMTYFVALSMRVVVASFEEVSSCR